MHGIIKFTFETEVNFCLPFLDLMVKRVESYIEFDIYRKPTNTDRCIPSSSYHPNQTKFAAFNSYCYRAVHVPLSKNNFIKEVDTIHRIATINGYSIQIVNSLLKKHMRKKELRDLTTLVSNKEKAITYMGGTFVEGLTYSLIKVLNNYSIKLSPNSTGNKVKTLIGTVKDKTDTLDKSGIYSVICQDCNEVYIGQTRRTAKIRWSEHYKSIHSKTVDQSTPADHMISNNHNLAGFRLLKQINNPKLLNAYEEIYIHRTNNMNKNKLFERSSLHAFLKPFTTKDIFETKF